MQTSLELTDQVAKGLSGHKVAVWAGCTADVCQSIWRAFISPDLESVAF